MNTDMKELNEKELDQVSGGCIIRPVVPNPIVVRLAAWLAGKLKR
ncbi:MAG: bacteriocin [Paracoccus sp. (in: a-proteobacteria)]|nr:bacteriocin [Paracoccus sp. (in: a-proteobacteria)]MDO5613989.1 bacteriocin [Paracoccus sp. (in: a-proteobacteria)]